MRSISVLKIREAVKKLCIDANLNLGEDVLEAFRACLKTEPSALGRQVIDTLIENAEIARTKKVPMCQDTGIAVVFAEIGQEVQFTDGLFEEAVQEGVRQGYAEGYLRKSIVEDPFRRVNTQDNTPAVIHTRLISGNQIKLSLAPKGGGSENMSEARVFPPAVGLAGIKSYVVDVVRRAGANPCPPVLVGVGIGGSFEKSALLAKQALLREIGSRNPDSYYADAETDWLDAVNELNIGPQGYGGPCTALDVFIEAHPCHIASLPVAVNLQCHAARHKTAVI